MSRWYMSSKVPVGLYGKILLQFFLLGVLFPVPIFAASLFLLCPLLSVVFHIPLLCLCHLDFCPLSLPGSLCCLFL